MKVFVHATLALAVALAPAAQASLPASVTALLDASVDPCDDFYQYACGGWIKSTSLTPTEFSKDASFSVLSERSDKVLREIADEDWPLVGELWDSCRDTAAIDALGTRALAAQFNRIKSATARVQVLRVAGELARTIDKPFGVQLRVEPDFRDATTTALFVSRAPLTLPTLAQSSDWLARHGAGYRKYVATLFGLAAFDPQSMSTAGGNRSSEVLADAMLRVETTLAALTPSSDTTRTPLTLSAAATRWPASVGAFLAGARVQENSKLVATSTVWFRGVDYLDALEKALADLQLDDIKAYLGFQLIHDRVPFLSAPFVDAYTAFFVTSSSGSWASTTRPKCLARTAQQLATQLTATAAKRVGQLQWHDDATRSQALATLGDLTVLLGQSTAKRSYPFSLARDAFYANVQAIRDNEFTTKTATLGGPVDRALWTISPADVTASYSTDENKLLLPAALLQAPVFDGDSVHPAQNFGALVGRELTRAYEATAASSTAFGLRAQCLVTQYSSFSQSGVNGTASFDENVADNGGFTLAWDAYHAYASSASFDAHGVTPAEADQLLFLSFAQMACSVNRDVAAAWNGPFAPAQWRANGVAINSVQFARTFACKIGSRMNPKSKCEAW